MNVPEWVVSLESCYWDGHDETPSATSVNRR